ncbi:MAG: O-antigen/teichoic acid export membrane protein [Arenicella sp.]|jgi:O-antigen/teichoic acid export membrane protein
MLRDLIKEGGLYTIANLLTKGVSLLLIPFYTAYFTTEDYGIIDVLSVFGILLTTIFSLQLNQGLGRYVAERTVEEIDKKKIASTTILIITAIYLSIGAIILFFPHKIADMLSTDETQIPINTLRLAVLSTLFAGLFYLFGVYMRFLRRVKDFTILSFAYALSNIFLMMYLILIKKMGIEGIYIATLIISPIFIVISIYLLRKNIIFYVGRIEFKQVFKYSAPLIPASIAYILMNSIDRFYIKEMLDFSEGGIYGIAFKFSTIITIIITGFTMAMNPIIFENHKNENAKGEIVKMFNFFFAIGSLGLIALSLFSYETLFIFTNPEYYEAADIMPIMYFSVLMSGMGMFSLGINIEKKTKVGAVIIIASALLNIVLNYYFVVNWGSIGAAISTLICVAIFYIAYFLVSQRYYYIDIGFKRIAPYFIFMMGIIIIGCYVINYSQEINMVIKLLLVLLYAITVYFAFIRKKTFANPN